MSYGPVVLFEDMVLVCALGDLEPGQSVAIEVHGTVDVRFGVLRDEACDDEIDSTIGPDSDSKADTGLELAMGGAGTPTAPGPTPRASRLRRADPGRGDPGGPGQATSA